MIIDCRCSHAHKAGHKANRVHFMAATFKVDRILSWDDNYKRHITKHLSGGRQTVCAESLRPGSQTNRLIGRLGSVTNYYVHNKKTALLPTGHRLTTTTMDSTYVCTDSLTQWRFIGNVASLWIRDGTIITVFFRSSLDYITLFRFFFNGMCANEICTPLARIDLKHSVRCSVYLFAFFLCIFDEQTVELSEVEMRKKAQFL